MCLELLVLQINMSYWVDIFAQNPGEDKAALAMQHTDSSFRGGMVNLTQRSDWSSPAALC